MFQPVIPLSGLGGWRFLQRTYDTQLTTFSQSREVTRDTDYFKSRIGEIASAQDLVSDRRLLGVALGAFGLQDDLSNRFFIRKVLEEGTTSDSALARKLSDPRYREMSEAFGFGPDQHSKVDQPGFADTMIGRFNANSFELASGEQDETMRIALYAQRALPKIADMDGSANRKWFTIMADTPLRQVVEKALGLPTAVGQIDIDQQLEIFKRRSRAVFGTDDPQKFSDEEVKQGLITKYIVRTQIQSDLNNYSSGAIALALLRR